MDIPCVRTWATFSTSRPTCRVSSPSGIKLVKRIRQRAAKAILTSASQYSLARDDSRVYRLAKRKFFLYCRNLVNNSVTKARFARNPLAGL